MKKMIIVLLVSVPSIAFCQFGINVHKIDYMTDYRSNDKAWVGLNFELKQRYRAEARVIFFNKQGITDIEGQLSYDFVNQPEYEFYTGIGLMGNEILLPLGTNLYPFKNRRLGFQIELDIPLNQSFFIRNTVGVKYRFVKMKKQ